MVWAWQLAMGSFIRRDVVAMSRLRLEAWLSSIMLLICSAEIALVWVDGSRTSSSSSRHVVGAWFFWTMVFMFRTMCFKIVPYSVAIKRIRMSLLCFVVTVSTASVRVLLFGMTRMGWLNNGAILKCFNWKLVGEYLADEVAVGLHCSLGSCFVNGSQIES